jgi:hypothetical protein
MLIRTNNICHAIICGALYESIKYTSLLIIGFAACVVNIITALQAKSTCFYSSVLPFISCFGLEY